MTKSIYIPKGELDKNKVEALAVWVADNVPPAPEGQLCESENCLGMEGIEAERPLADGSFSFRVEEGHVCYSYVCQSCQDSLTPPEEYIDETGYPSGAGGYAVSPKHCT